MMRLLVICFLIGAASMLVCRVLRKPNQCVIKWAVLGGLAPAILLVFARPADPAWCTGIVSYFYNDWLGPPVGPLVIACCAAISGSTRAVLSCLFSRSAGSI